MAWANPEWRLLYSEAVLFHLTPHCPDLCPRYIGFDTCFWLQLLTDALSLELLIALFNEEIGQWNENILVMFFMRQKELLRVCLGFKELYFSVPISSFLIFKGP